MTITEDIEKLAERVAEATGTSPEEVMRQALLAQARQIGIPLDGDQPPRKPGRLKGTLVLPDAFFFEPLPADELKQWNAEGEVA